MAEASECALGPSGSARTIRVALRTGSEANPAIAAARTALMSGGVGA
ncbi:hypothetical protein [Agromyces sp. NPDC057865]